MTTDRNPTASVADGASPFSLPAMSDSYPLDERERREIGELLADLEHEREQPQEATAALARQGSHG